MKAIKVTVGKEESMKINPFIDEINKDEDSASYMLDKSSFILATVDDCGIAYMKSVISSTFENYDIDILK